METADKVVKDWLIEREQALRVMYPGNSSFSLANSIEHKFQVETDGVKLELSLNNYAKFLHFGVNGMLKSWGSKYSFKSIYPSKSMADSIGSSMRLNNESIKYAIATNVKKKGIKPTRFMDKVFSDAAYNDLQDKLAEVYLKKITIETV
jgi:hypothetical protein